MRMRSRPTPGMKKVHRLAEHVLAELRDAAAAPAQHRIGGGRAIGRNDLDRGAAVDVLVDLPDRVEQPRVHFGLGVVAPVAQEIIELGEPGFIVAAAALERDRQRVIAMGVVQRESAGVAVGRSALQTLGAQDQDAQR